MEGILLVAVIVLAFWVIGLRRRLKPCERCGVVGSTRSFSGNDAWPRYFRPPLKLCQRCGWAQQEFLDHLFMLDTESRFQFGRKDLVALAERDWGKDAAKMLALLYVAEKDLDLASRILTPQGFERVRPWIQSALGDRIQAPGGGRCRRCIANVEAGDLFCPNCGLSLSRMSV